MSTIKKALVCLTLLVVGWTLGYAQRSQPQFTLSIDAPGGETTVECISGCDLLDASDVENPGAGRLKKYWYRCGKTVERCGARVAGWLAQ